jgi:pyruvate,orthophosphate dikinase
MFREDDRLPIVQEMILADSVETRQPALDRLLPIQRSDFSGIFQAMDGLPVVIRLLDPPLHEFLPDPNEIRTERDSLVATGSNPELLTELEHLLHRVEDLHEANPMLGLRGCRLGIEHPEIYEMQVRAIIEAAVGLTAEGFTPRPKIMIPLVGHVNELKALKPRLRKIADDVLAANGSDVTYEFGTMIEVPRACSTAGDIANVADFFSFGTNDLTQTAFGISRDDAEGKFLMNCVESGILPSNPFQVLDRDGVGVLIQTAVVSGREAAPNIEMGVCGEHGGDPESIAFCEQIKVDYVSASPFRVPVARMAAAHALLGTLERDR